MVKYSLVLVDNVAVPCFGVERQANGKQRNTNDHWNMEKVEIRTENVIVINTNAVSFSTSPFFIECHSEALRLFAA